jgi:hypothetical protein
MDWIHDSILKEWNKCQGIAESATGPQGTQEVLNDSRKEARHPSEREDIGYINKTLWADTSNGSMHQDNA